MACEAFINYRPQTATRRIIDQANAIIAQYLDQGLKLTLRQLFYQFVARALIPNTFQNYKRLGGIISDARDGGLIDWDAMDIRKLQFPKDLQFHYDNRSVTINFGPYHLYMQTR